MTNASLKNKKDQRHLDLTHRFSPFGEAQGGLLRTAWFIGLLMLVMGIAELDYMAGKSIHLFIFFLVPIVLSVWKLGIRVGLGMSCLCTISGFLIDVYFQQNSTLFFASANALIRSAIYLLSTYASWKIRAMGDALAKLSLVDSLTGLHNRRAFLLHGREELNRMRRNNQPLSVLFLDLDNFKFVNDTLGHDAGDDVLKTSAETLKKILRQTDFPARLGGDEFAAILPSTDGVGSLELVGKAQAALREIFSAKNLPVTASIGIATFTQPPNSFEHVLQCADRLMYEVKNASKNDVLQRNISIENR